ncbi:hypothetical protein DACRYDRAFT_21641 [Dacryopinax primogenitus]|uniref:Uncharacterized protein n=1 Tax=Dacryopinax primogenitus (strain DJM 731) TaxID=1858805 RepID=M5G1H3_DACPD|nr:uncharacterized protein DACRYDRAFT_21641 [Dacryopinax primogenitus]EJU02579.1 hypothetical protein DACRYDRAFT_21641 [Dacryopinax primogenitus]
MVCQTPRPPPPLPSSNLRSNPCSTNSTPQTRALTPRMSVLVFALFPLPRVKGKHLPAIQRLAPPPRTPAPHTFPIQCILPPSAPRAPPTSPTGAQCILPPLPPQAPGGTLHPRRLAHHQLPHAPPRPQLPACQGRHPTWSSYGR